MYILIYKYFKFILLAAFVAMMGGVIGYELTGNELYFKVWGKATFLFSILGIYFLHTTGSFIKSNEYRISKIAVSVLIVGILFKIMHWPFAIEVIAAGLVLIWSFYLYYMIKNNQYLWTNWLTLLLLITLTSDRFLILSHIYSGGALMIVSIAILIVLLTFRLKDIKDKGLDKL